MTPRTPCYAWFVAIGACLALAASAQGQPVLYVDGTATGANDGSSWCDAYLYLQDALAAAAASGGVVTEIRVAQGIYTADRSTANPDGTGDREATFQLLNGVALRGGYAGCGAPDPDERDIALYETILSGDLNRDDGPHFANNEENSYVVLIASGGVLDGVSISGANGFTGVRIERGSFTHCTFHGNSGESGVYHANGEASFSRCVFRDNRGAGLVSVGLCVTDIVLSRPTLVDCTFAGNTGRGMVNGCNEAFLDGCRFVRNAGGGMYSSQVFTTVFLFDCQFNENTAETGGGMYNDGNVAYIGNCIFSGNTARHGGGIFNRDSSPSLNNCTFSENSAVGVGGMYNLGFSRPSLTNCILWGNTDSGGTGESAQVYGGMPTINYSCLQGLTVSLGGVGNIGSDPLFVPGPAGCHYLSQTAAGQAEQSPCVDGGSDTAAIIELDSVTTRSDEVGDTGIVDMGYHYPITGKTLIMGDFDRDQRVDLRDFAEFQQCFTGGGATDVTPCCRIFDFEADADVDLRDLPAFESAVTGP